MDIKQQENNQMNVFKALFSGNRIFKEEFASSFLGYALSPFKSHQNEYNVLIDLLKNFPQLQNVINKIEERKWASFDLFSENLNLEVQNISLLEYENIDILIKIDKYILVFENKIYPTSIGKDGINAQLLDYYKVIEQKAPNHTIIPFAIYPDYKNYSKNISSLDIYNGIECYHLFWRGGSNSISTVLRKYFPDFADFVESKFNGYRQFNMNYDPIDLKSFLENHFANQGDTQNFIKELLKDYTTSTSNKCDWNGPILCIKNKAKTKTAWPFKIKTSGKIVIQHQGLSSEPFSYRTWRYEGKNIVDIIKLILNQDCISKEDEFDFNHFYIQDISKEENKKNRLIRCLKVLQDMLENPEKINKIVSKNI